MGATVIDPSGTVTEMTLPPGATTWPLADLQKFVGGYVEVVRRHGLTGKVVLVNEDGYALGLAPNHAATAAVGIPPVCPLLGTVVVIPAATMH